MSPIIERILGTLLRPVHAGERHLASNAEGVSAAPELISLSSPDFVAGCAMPALHAAPDVGGNVSPALNWTGLPHGAVEIALIVQDPSAPLRKPVVHLIAFGIPASMQGVEQGGLTPAHGCDIRFGTGSFGRVGYSGPRPVLGHGRHTYVFQIFALDRPLGATGAPDLDAVLGHMQGAVLARGRLIGTYERP
jgi:Raf kinase inhibitor-like YbhB/YbcL family protein